MENKFNLYIFIKALKYFSIGTFDPKAAKPFVNRTHCVVHVVTWLIIALCLAGGCFDGYDLNETIFTMAMLVYMTVSFMKYVAFSFNGTTVHKLIPLVEIDAVAHTKTDVHVKKAVKDTLVVVRNYLLVTAICTVMYLVQTFLAEKQENGEIKARCWELIHIYLPYDFVIYGRFGVTRIIITLFFYYHGYCHIFLDLFSASLFTHVGRQFEAVADMFVNIQYSGNNKEYKIRLKEAIEYHQIILRYSADPQQMYNFAFFVQLVGCCLPLCFCMLLVVNIMKTTDGNLFDVYGHILLLVLQVYTLFLYTRVADLIKQRALLVSEGVYLSDWHLASPSTRRDLLWIIACAQRPIEYSALGIFPMTISTFVQIMRSVYGALSLLTNVD